VEGWVGVFVFVLLTRGFGQSALSVASLTLIGRSAGTRTGLAMGVYSCLTSLGFVAAMGVLRGVVGAHPDEWREPWAGIGVGVLVAAVLSLVLVRDGVTGVKEAATAEPSRTLGQALRSPAFWAFALGTSFFGLVSSGTSLFNESILAERGFSKSIFLNVMVLGIPVGLAANLLGGWLATKVPLGKLFAASLLLLAATLAVFPLITAEWQVYAYAAALAVAGGVITVCFFTVWRRVYGPAALGRIQGAAQLLTVLFSAVGPLLLAVAKTRLSNYAVLFPALAASAAALAVFAWVVRVNPPEPTDDRRA
jgi:MFS family permease